MSGWKGPVSEKDRAELDQLLARRELFPRRLFLIALENVAVFGVPALGAVLLGIRFGYLWLLLILALVFSWGIFFFRFRAVVKEMKNLERAIDEERERLGIEKPKAPGYDDEEDEGGEDENENLSLGE